MSERGEWCSLPERVTDDHDSTNTADVDGPMLGASPGNRRAEGALIRGGSDVRDHRLRRPRRRLRDPVDGTTEPGVSRIRLQRRRHEQRTGITVVKREGKIRNLEAEPERATRPAAWVSDTPAGARTALPRTATRTHTPTATGRSPWPTTGSSRTTRAQRELAARGHTFTSDTDTEVVPHLLEEALDDGCSPVEALQETVDRLEGSYAIVFLSEDHDAIYATRNGSPLVLGIDGERRFLASDVPSFLDFTSDVVYLEDGDIVQAEAGSHTVVDSDGNTVSREMTTVDWSPEDAEQNGYPHFMLKEINEQPAALKRALEGRITEDGAVDLNSFPPGTFEDVSEVHFIACGTSYHAALYARQLLVDRGVPAHVFTAGEYVTTPAPISPGDARDRSDTERRDRRHPQSLRHASREGARTVAVTNVVGSTAAREADDALFIRAGPEIGVAATKTFSSQVAVLGLLSDRLVTDVTGSPPRTGSRSCVR